MHGTNPNCVSLYSFLLYGPARNLRLLRFYSPMIPFIFSGVSVSLAMYTLEHQNSSSASVHHVGRNRNCNQITWSCEVQLGPSRRLVNRSVLRICRFQDEFNCSSSRFHTETCGSTLNRGDGKCHVMSLLVRSVLLARLPTTKPRM